MLVIRKPREAEIKTLAALEHVCFPEEEAASSQVMRARYEAFPDNFLVAESDGVIRGYINGCSSDSGTLTDDMYHDCSLHDPCGPWLMVFGLGVHPNARQHGLAGTLLRSFIALARKRGQKGVVLTCKDHLVHYYSRFGFQDMGVSESVHGGNTWHEMQLVFDRDGQPAGLLQAAAAGQTDGSDE